MKKHSLYQRIDSEISKVVVGQKDLVRDILTAFLARGHILLLGLPGLAKTLTVKAVSRTFDAEFRRVQFTPDLMPGDLIGYDVLNEVRGRKELHFIKGPVFTNLLLADEINRTPPKTQAALLQAMQEREITVMGKRYELPEPFLVLATQNPLEQEGTYPLPEAQLDRFMFMVKVDYPAYDEELKIAAHNSEGDIDSIKSVFRAGDLIKLQKEAAAVHIDERVTRWIVKMVHASRPGNEYAISETSKYIQVGASPRASRFIIESAKAAAFLEGQREVERKHIEQVIYPVLRHRLYLNFTAEADKFTADDFVKQLLRIKI